MHVSLLENWNRNCIICQLTETFNNIDILNVTCKPEMNSKICVTLFEKAECHAFELSAGNWRLVDSMLLSAQIWITMTLAGVFIHSFENKLVKHTRYDHTRRLMPK